MPINPGTAPPYAGCSPGQKRAGSTGRARGALAIALAALASALAGCNPRVESGGDDSLVAGAPAYGDTFIEASIADIAGLPPNITSDGASHEVGSLIYDALVETDKELPGEVRIVYFSDSHFSVMTSRGHARRIAKAIKSGKPDIVVACGDIIDSGREVVGQHMKHLAGIPCRHGKYAVPGNHERAAGIEGAVDLFRESGFTVLRGETVDVDPRPRVLGNPLFKVRDDRKGAHAFFTVTSYL